MLPSGFTSLKSKIISRFSLVIVIVGILTVSIVFFLSIKQSTDQTKKYLLDSVQEKSYELQSYFERTKRKVLVYSGKELVVDQFSKKNYSLVLPTLELLKDANEYMAVYAMDATGRTVVSTDPRFLDQNFSFRSYFAQALNGGVGTEQNLGSVSNELGFYFSHAIYNKDQKIIGVLVIKQSADKYVEFIKTSHLFSGAKPMLVKSDGTILYSNIDQRLLKNLTDFEYGKVLAEIKSYTAPLTIDVDDELDKKQELFTISRVGDSDLFFLLESNYDAIYARAGSFAGIISATVALTTIICIIILYLGVQKTLNPLKQLGEYVASLEQGNTKSKHQINSKDEIEQAASLIQHFAESINGFNSQLEQKVQAKTSELNERVKELEATKTAMVNVFQDLDDQKIISDIRAQELQKFKLAVDNASDHIVITDANANILYANQSVSNITGYSRDEIIGKTPSLWGKQMPDEFYKMFWDTIKNKKQSFAGEVTNKRKNGEKYVASVSIAPVLNKVGEVVFFVGIERDVTKAKEIDRMKTEFISLASHQLRTPLTAIKWYIEMLLNGDAGKLSKEQLAFLTQVDESNERMISLVNSLLNVSRIESGRILVEPKPTDLKQLINGVISEVQPKLQQKNMSIITDIHQEMPLINLDQNLVRQVYLNLLTNSIKYTPDKGEIHIFVSKRKDDILTQISDTGYGIPDKDKDKVFSKLYRGENIVQIETDGNGLGLYLVKAIVESSKGKIWFESAEGKGTTFWFTLPLTGMKYKKGEVRIDS